MGGVLSQYPYTVVPTNLYIYKSYKIAFFIENLQND